MIPVWWLTNREGIDSHGPWDTAILDQLFDGGLWPVHFDTVHHRNVSEVFEAPFGIVIVPARHHCRPEDVEWLNGEIAKLESVILFLVGDEEGEFPWQEIRHDCIRFWVQMPDPSHYGDMAHFGRFFGNGVPHPTRSAIGARMAQDGSRGSEWAFAGQVTNKRRKRAANGLRKARPKGNLLATRGFGEGLDPGGYAEALCDAWVLPCPGGPKHVDTFRMYEALESCGVPILDCTDGGNEYWDLLDPAWDRSLVGCYDWDTVGGLIEDILAERHMRAARAAAWWQQRKRWMVQRLETDITDLSGIEIVKPAVTALVTTSPVPSNPSLDMIIETIASIPDGWDVIVACDGVRPEQSERRAAYGEFLYNLVVWCEHHNRNIVPVISPEWLHQTGLTRLALNHIDTPVLLFMEHDTPLVTDEPIDWDGCVGLVAQGHLDVLRFHHEAHVLPDHERLMVDFATRAMFGVPVRRTHQWSQRPHLIRADYLRLVLAWEFSPNARCFIEDKMHSVCQGQPYDKNRLAIYHPEGNIKRSYHIDGRGQERKFEESQVF